MIFVIATMLQYVPCRNFLYFSVFINVVEWEPPPSVNKTNAEKEADFQLDAAQRKKLPLWIREGLEKMEREKKKKVWDMVHYFG